MLKLPPAAPLQVVQPLPGWPSDMEVALLRMDLVHARYGGNKYYKLYYNVLEAQQLGLPLLTFGGAYSNHIAATAAAAAEAGIPATGIIRGDELHADANDVLRFAASCGMQLYFVSRSEYRRRYDAGYHSELKQRFGAFYSVPEGGTNALAVKGFAHALPPEAYKYAHIVCATGTGGTLAGLAAAAKPHQRVTGIAVVNDSVRIRERVGGLLRPYPDAAQWELEERFTFGGYAQADAELEVFCREVSAVWGINADLQYVGKMLFGVNAMVGEGELGRDVLIVCSGRDSQI
ncbi:MAG: pyridoxal-phosphate dependent enzyme [Bacteroidetes bacterium]|nr:pyridoxal-phosphate dependent enzyme [Bacteroidota bacterium]